MTKSLCYKQNSNNIKVTFLFVDFSCRKIKMISFMVEETGKLQDYNERH